MTTQSTSELLATRLAHFKQTQADDQAMQVHTSNDNSQSLRSLSGTATIFTPKPPTDLPLLIKPPASTWEALEKQLTQVINLPGLWKTIEELYAQGYGAELATAAEIALATAKKSPFHLFATMTSKKAGKWSTITLNMVHETWDVRRNAREVIDRLKLPVDSVKAILALSWRLKGTIIRFLGIATERGTGIKNPIGVFFALTKQQQSTA